MLVIKYFVSSSSLSSSSSSSLSLSLSPSPSQLKAHRCLSFTGCTVTVTGLEEKERRRVKQVVEDNGGVYSGELTKDVCTHLIVASTTSTYIS